MTFFILSIYLLLSAYIIRTVRNSLYAIFLWQLKEYRWDRIFAHLSTPLGKKLLLNPISTAKNILFLILLVLSPIFIIQEFGSQIFLYILYVVFIFLFWLIWVFEAIINTRELFTRGWLRPRFTAKVLFVFIAVLITQFPYLILGEITTNQLFLGILLDRLLYPMVTFFVIVINIPSFLYKKRIISKAQNKITQFKNLKVIGITGSYGKTSTKEFLAQILSAKFKVLKTEGFVNTEIGVAQTILRDLTPALDFFIVEMGAYRKGEIEAICRMVKPQVGIITGINQQHLQLFGSLEKTVAAKFELIENLSQKGIAVFNADNKWVNEMVIRTKRQRPDLEVVTYGCRGKSNLVAGNIQTTAENIKFNLLYSGKKESLQLQLAGEQNVVNFLGAAAASLKLGVSFSEIKKSALKIQAPTKTMKKVSGINQSAFIDDTFNANPDGVMAALNYMKIYKGKKILVLTPLIELGNDADKIHKDLGKKAAWVCDLILLTNLNYNSPFLEGAAVASGSKKVQIVNTAVGIKLIKQNIDRDGIVIFEGKEAGRILESLVISH